MLSAAFDRAGATQFCTAGDLDEVVDEIDTAENAIEFYEYCLHAVADRVGADETQVSAVARAYDTIIDHSDVEFVPGAETVLSDIGEEYQLGLVTNGGRETQQTKLDALGIADVFDAFAFANPEKGIKPDPSPFHRVLGELDATPEECIHIGDSLASDVAGAHAAGIDSVWIPYKNREGPNEPTPTHTLDSLHELHAVIAETESRSSNAPDVEAR